MLKPWEVVVFFISITSLEFGIFKVLELRDVDVPSVSRYITTGICICLIFRDSASLHDHAFLFSGVKHSAGSRIERLRATPGLALLRTYLGPRKVTCCCRCNLRAC